MSESDEHKYLTTAILTAMERMAGLDLYTYRETRRRRFDFGCELQSDWTHAVAGQTLWKHVEGVDKDVRTLLTDEDAAVVLYVARDTIKARGIFHEAVTDFRRLGMEDRLHKLKVFWVPADFDADDELARSVVDAELLRRATSDILLNVVLGNLRDEHITHFLRGTGRIALDFAILDAAAEGSMYNVSMFAERLQVSRSSLPQRIDRLIGCGFLDDITRAHGYRLSHRGAVFMELTGIILEQLPDPSAELLQMLAILDLDPPLRDLPSFAPPELWNSHRLTSLVWRAGAAMEEWDVSFDRTWIGTVK